MRISHYNATSILTPTGGFLREGYTHTLNPAIGCAYGKGLCGQFCYARQGMAHMHNNDGLTWGDYVKIKVNAAELLDKELTRAANRDPDHPHHISRLAIFASSSTDPCAGPVLEVFRRCLTVVARYPVKKFVVQTRAPQVVKLKEEIEALGSRAVVSFTIETDSDQIWNIGPKGAPGIEVRRRALEALKGWRTTTHLAVSPCLKLVNPVEFADWIAAHADYATSDTFTAGDGSPNGRRTSRTSLPVIYQQQSWNWRDESQAKLLLELLRERMGDRAAWSCQGFNRLSSA